MQWQNSVVTSNEGFNQRRGIFARNTHVGGRDRDVKNKGRLDDVTEIDETESFVRNEHVFGIRVTVNNLCAKRRKRRHDMVFVVINDPRDAIFHCWVIYGIEQVAQLPDSLQVPQQSRFFTRMRVALKCEIEASQCAAE